MSYKNKGRFKNQSYKLEKNGELYFIDDIVINMNELKNGMEIIWLADDTDFDIWFPKDRNPFSTFYFLRSLPAKSRNCRIKKRIRKNLKPGTYYYCLYCKNNKTMAEGNSFPKMIIR